MGEIEEKNAKRLRDEILKKLLKNLKNVPQSEFGKRALVEVYLGEVGEQLSDVKFNILKKLHKKKAIKECQVTEVEFNAGQPPKNPSSLEIELDFDGAIERYNEKKILYEQMTAENGTLHGTAKVYYIPFDFIKYVKKNHPYILERVPKPARQPETIKSIIIVKPRTEEGDKIKIVLNDMYASPIEVNRNLPTWELLLEIADQQYADFRNKSSLDYLNTNKENPIYKSTGLKLTKILTKSGEQILPDPNIKIKAISFTAYQKRLKKTA
jgi:hypothetical protein